VSTFFELFCAQTNKQICKQNDHITVSSDFIPSRDNWAKWTSEKSAIN